METPRGTLGGGADGNAPESIAARLFSEFIAAAERGAPDDIARLCRANPDQAEELWARFDEWCAIQRTIRRADESIRLSGTSTADSAWQGFLKQLESRGPTHSRYVFQGELARGGMGVIHRVFDQDAQRTLAMKVVLGSEEGARTGRTPVVDDRTLGRFLEEAQVTSQLDHPGFVPVHEIGVDAAKNVYFTMKLVKGEDLRFIIERVHDPADTEWTLPRALAVIQRVCEAMSYAHAKGVIHRDLKPGNIMVGRFGEVYVMDWGLARVLGRVDARDSRTRSTATDSLRSDRRDAARDMADQAMLTMEGDVVGTPAYMPPEQAEGKIDEVGPQSDVYAIGAILYHLIAGEMPFMRKGTMASNRTILARVLDGSPKPLFELAPKAPAELISIVERAMARERNERYPSMAALADDLRAFLENRVVRAHRTGVLAEVRKWIVRNPALFAAIAALVAVVCIGTTMVFWKNNELEEAYSELRVKAAAVEDRQARFDRLAGVVKLENALRSEARLFPPWPQQIPAMESWLAHEAAELVELMPDIAETVRSFSDSSTDSAHDSDPRTLVADDARSFLRMTLEDLAHRLHEFETRTLPSVKRRLSWARRIEEVTLNHPRARSDWATARASIAAADGVVASKLYGENRIDLVPQIGLVPIGMNPRTKLWEFIDLRSACDIANGDDPAEVDIPRHDELGAIDIESCRGVIFVLLPGGSHVVGAQRSDPHGELFDPNAESDEYVQRVVLEPFFIARHELTRAQWSRMSEGKDPSFNSIGTSFPNDESIGGNHPVEGVSWNDCVELLRRNGSSLPTEVQWEYAARAGTMSPWWSGADAETLSGIANVLDRRAESEFPSWGRQAGDFDDGHIGAARVGSFRDNAFGLFDVHGNVWEWCLDRYGRIRKSARPGDGLREPNASDSSDRVYRGGSYILPATNSRSANRMRSGPELRTNYLGVRPVRNLRRADG